MNKVSAFLVAVLLTLPFLVWGGLRIAYAVSFSIHCEGHLKRAADANTIGLAKQEMDTALAYIDSQKLTQGSTHLIFPTPECDLGFWHDNLQSAADELSQIPSGASKLEKTNVLMKLRETLLDQAGDNVVVTIPPGITVFPNQWLYLLWGWGSALGACIGWIFFVIALND